MQALSSTAASRAGHRDSPLRVMAFASINTLNRVGRHASQVQGNSQQSADIRLQILGSQISFDHVKLSRVKPRNSQALASALIPDREDGNGLTYIVQECPMSAMASAWPQQARPYEMGRLMKGGNRSCLADSHIHLQVRSKEVDNFALRRDQTSRSYRPESNRVLPVAFVMVRLSCTDRRDPYALGRRDGTCTIITECRSVV